MYLGGDAKTWSLAGAVILVGMAWAQFRPDSHEEHSERVIEQFHLPADVEFLELHSGWGRFGGEYVEANIQLTPEQYEAFAAGLEDPEIWTFTGFEHGNTVVSSEHELGWDKWWEGDLAYIVELDKSPHGERTRKLERVLKDSKYKAIMWGGWGHVNRNPKNGGPNVYEEGKHRSFCWAFAEQDGKKAARACTDYPPTQWSPELYVRARLNDDTRRLYVHIR